MPRPSSGGRTRALKPRFQCARRDAEKTSPWSRGAGLEMGGAPKPEQSPGGLLGGGRVIRARQARRARSRGASALWALGGRVPCAAFFYFQFRKRPLGIFGNAGPWLSK